MTGEEIQIREATLDDVPRLSALLGILFSQEADFAPDAELQSRGLALILSNRETGRIYCACQGGAVVGMVSILFTVSTAEGARAATLEDMIVHPDYRGRGIGGQLLQEAIRGARESGCKRMTLLTDATNAAAISFYSRVGFKRSQMIPLRLAL